jgi:hypothetical protein
VSGRVHLKLLSTLDLLAWNYVKLLRVLEIIDEALNEAGYPFDIVDGEMALFMMGK